MKPLLINVGVFLAAIDDRRPGQRWYFNADTGELYVLPDAAEPPKWRYIAIEPWPSAVAWSIMRDFAEQLPEAEVKAELTKATKLSQPFRHFQSVLASYPEVQEAWTAFWRASRLQLVRVWLENHGVSADLNLELLGR